MLRKASKNPTILPSCVIILTISGRVIWSIWAAAMAPSYGVTGAYSQFWVKV